METLLRAIITELVEFPDEIQVHTRRSPRGTVMELKVHPEDIARIIGKQGRVINALRTIAKAAGTRDQAKVFLNLITPEDLARQQERGPRRGPGGPGRGFRR